MHMVTLTIPIFSQFIDWCRFQPLINLDAARNLALNAMFKLILDDQVARKVARCLIPSGAVPQEAVVRSLGLMCDRNTSTSLQVNMVNSFKFPNK